MDLSLFVVVTFAYAAMLSLPSLFFRQEGRKNTLMWWVTASPFMIGYLSLCFARFMDTSRMEPAWLRTLCSVSVDGTAGVVLVVISAAFAIGSFGVITATVASHRVPIALWHQPNDAPVSIVTHGPYSRVRHPFYASFLLLLLATIAATRSPVSVLAFVAAFTLLDHTARREEVRLAASTFGEEYKRYMSRTRRFIPRLRSVL